MKITSKCWPSRRLVGELYSSNRTLALDHPADIDEFEDLNVTTCQVGNSLLVHKA